MPRPRERQFDIDTIKLQLKYGTPKNKICELHDGLTLYKLNCIIEERELQLKLKITDDQLKFILSTFVSDDKQTWGYHFINSLFTQNGIKIPKNQLVRVLRELDPDASANRWALNVSRIPQCYTAGPMHVWCMDAHCKLSAFGIYTYLIVDFATTVVLDVYVMRNMRPESVFVSYHNALVVTKGINPYIDRMDAGGETVFVKMHQQFRMGLGHIIVGKSTRNIMVEKQHRSHYEKVGYYMKNILKHISDLSLYDCNNIIHIHSIFEVFAPVYQQKLNCWAKAHNLHKRRNQPNRNKPSGVPLEEFNSFFSKTDVGKQQYQQYKQNRWNYIDLGFENYSDHIRNFLMIHDSAPIEIPESFDFNKTKLLPGCDIMGEKLSENGIIVRNTIISMFMPNLAGFREGFQLIFEYLVHRITTEEILILTGQSTPIHRVQEPNTYDLRMQLQNWLYRLLNIC